MLSFAYFRCFTVFLSMGALLLVSLISQSFFRRWHWVILVRVVSSMHLESSLLVRPRSFTGTCLIHDREHWETILNWPLSVLLHIFIRAVTTCFYSLVISSNQVDSSFVSSDVIIDFSEVVKSHLWQLHDYEVTH